MKNFVVAIDGPAGSGKSSISKMVAKSLGFTHLDTGAMYRAVTLYCLRNGIDLEDESKYDFLDTVSVINNQDRTYINGEDVTAYIRTEEVTNNVSIPSRLKRVRDKMVEFQRESAKAGKTIVDGRDIGTVVLPNADLKVFLTASPEERAKRRCKENALAGIESDYNIILKEIIERDYKDSHRDIAPLKQASDAILLDTTSMSIDEVCEAIIKMINVRLNKMEKFTMEDFDMPKKLRAGDKVTGTVVSIANDKTIYLDINQFTEGTMHLDHYTKDKEIVTFHGYVNVGDVINCEVAKVTEESIYLSRLNQIVVENFKKVSDAFADGTDIEVKVVSVVEGKGFTVSFGENRLFMPASQAPADTKVGNVLTVRIIDCDDERRRAVVSRRVIDNEIYQDNKSKEYDGIQVGDVLTGKIVKVEKYGAIVRFNYNQGLLKTNQVSHYFIDITKELNVGDDIEVKVVAKADGKIELSRKALLDSPFTLYVKEHKVSDKVTGKVVNKLGFGLLIELAKDVKGLLHSSEYSHNPNDNFDACVVIGDEIEVAIISIKEDGEKISLSRKALMDNPWERVNANVGDLVDVKVTEVNEKGLAVEALGVDGVVPMSEAVIELKGDLKNEYAPGDTAKAYILDINPREWRLKLSIRKFLVEEERKSFEKHLTSDETPNATLGDMFKDVLK